jgi:hypothetical protein
MEPEGPDLYEHAKHSCVLDLHGYPVWDACEVAKEFVKAAWEAGHDRVVLIHGARAAHHPSDELVRAGYGGIKMRLRALLDAGEFDPYARSPRSSEHRREATRLIIALEPQHSKR